MRGYFWQWLRVWALELDCHAPCPACLTSNSVKMRQIFNLFVPQFSKLWKMRVILLCDRVVVKLKINNSSKAVCTQSRLKEEIQFCVEVMTRIISQTAVGSTNVWWGLVDFGDASLKRKRKGGGWDGQREQKDACEKTEKEGAEPW